MLKIRSFDPHVQGTQFCSHVKGMQFYSHVKGMQFCSHVKGIQFCSHVKRCSFVLMLRERSFVLMLRGHSFDMNVKRTQFHYEHLTMNPYFMQSCKQYDIFCKLHLSLDMFSLIYCKIKYFCNATFFSYYEWKIRNFIFGSISLHSTKMTNSFIFMLHIKK